MSRRFSLLACLALTTACFNPDDPAADTDPGGTDGSTGSNPTASTTDAPTSGSPSTSTDGSTTIDPTEADSSSGEGSSSSGGSEVPDWGEGDPPDFGDLGEEGEGNVLAVHALPIMESVDVTHFSTFGGERPKIPLEEMSSAVIGTSSCTASSSRASSGTPAKLAMVQAIARPAAMIE